jgi:hypothetical protein
MMPSAPRRILTLALCLPVFAPLAAAQDAFQWGGFASLRGGSNNSGPFVTDQLGAQLQLGLDWSASPTFLAHVHLLARTDDGEAERGHAGTPEAYLEFNTPAGAGRLRLRGGAFFLPTSRENVDALWENPYAISSSALNTWFGEELRPVGLDASWMQGGFVLGGTLFRGNDTFGALPVDRGWALHDRWTLLGEKVESGEYFTSVSAENDGRLGYAARGGYGKGAFAALFTHIDNRSDGRLYGDLYNWTTRFELFGAELSRGDWTAAGEFGWGPTTLVFPGGSATDELRAGYLLVSRRLPRGRLSVRFDAWRGSYQGTDELRWDRSVTAAAFWSPLPRLRAGVELAASRDATRVLVDLRYGFSRR